MACMTLALVLLLALIRLRSRRKPKRCRDGEPQKEAMEWDKLKSSASQRRREASTPQLTEQMDKMGKYDPITGQFVANDAVKDIYGS